MQCRAHPDVAADAPCAFCGDHFCASCTIQLGGRTTCETCKPRALALAASSRREPDGALRYFVPSGRNGFALAARWCGLLSLLVFPFGVVGGPLAVGLGVAGVRRASAVNDGFYASWMAVVLGTLGLAVSLAFWVSVTAR